MKKLIVLAAGLSVLLGGCGLFRHDEHRGGYSANPQVVISDKPDPSGNPSFFVSPHTLVFKEPGRSVEIVWSLPKDAKLRFSPRLGIFIEGEIKQRVERLPKDGGNDKAATRAVQESTYLDPDQNEIVDCKVRESGLQFSCQNKHTRPGRYKYSVRLTDGNADYLIDPDMDNW